ncbi:MAG TPA: hypothetical protein VM327_08500 [Candidatus Thermoplasmatota archaeon]|nr:hypothetical protein [Candidatus Thermoplasmatota archaeon]
MVRRLLLTTLVAMLAVAVPAAAEGDAAPAPGSEGSGSPACPPLALFCQPFRETASQGAPPAVEGLFPSSEVDDGSSCRVFDVSNDADPMHAIDPDGCWWRVIRRTLGIGTETLPSVRAWTADPLPLPFP